MIHSRRKFKLVKLLGVGGFGEVYLADMSTPSGFTKTVALKLLKEDVNSTDDVAARMRDEARMLGLLRHRSIVQADDLISIGGRISVVMEFIPGCNLSSLLARSCYRPDIPLRVVLHVAAEMADALVAAYSRPSTVTGEPLKVLHRDIKPANVRITPDGEVKILDFGIARAEQMERAAQTQEVALGSLYYMAPEVLAGKGASLASDIYALGVTFVESMIRSRFGLAADTEEEHTAKINRKLEDIDFSGNESHQVAIEKLVHQMLAFAPQERAGGDEVVRAAQALVAELTGPTMVQWARDAVPKVAEGGSEGMGDADLSGTELFEDAPVTPVATSHPSDLFDEATLGVSSSGEPLENTLRPSGTGRPSLWVVVAGLVVIFGLAAFAVDYSSRAEEAVTEAKAKVASDRAVAATTARLAAELKAEKDKASDVADKLEKARIEEEEAKVAAQAKATEKAKRPQVSAGSTAKAKPRPSPSAQAVDVSIKLFSSPLGIPVSLDGKSIGKTPIKVTVKSGAHIVVFHDGDKAIRKTITVSAGQKTRWKYQQASGSVK